MIRLHQLRQMHKQYGALRHYAALDKKASRDDVKRYRAWRRAWRDAIMAHIKRADTEGHKRRRERRKAERKQQETILRRLWQRPGGAMTGRWVSEHGVVGKAAWSRLGRRR